MKKRYDRVAPDSENEFLYQVWRRKARKANNKYTLEEMDTLLEAGEIEVEVLPTKR
tara:strand:- start:3613 stop:3780 length:168 start_codon:yes stop_codon:yes gene_type:complete